MTNNLIILGLAFLLASAVLIVVQVIYVRKLQKLELEELARKLKEEFSTKIDKRALDLQSYIEEAVERKLREKL
ncbi:MAG: hypothetical protein AAB364_01020 [Patescibacteria group bacterium]